MLSRLSSRLSLKDRHRKYASYIRVQDMAKLDPHIKLVPSISGRLKVLATKLLSDCGTDIIGTEISHKTQLILIRVLIARLSIVNKNRLNNILNITQDHYFWTPMFSCKSTCRFETKILPIICRSKNKTLNYF